jgi:hypothetical protein
MRYIKIHGRKIYEFCIDDGSAAMKAVWTKVE